MQNFPYARTFWYWDFKITKKSFFIKIEECGKNVQLLNKKENTKENLINFPDWFLYMLSGKQSGKLMEFSFVFSLIFKNQTFFPYTSILTKNVFVGYFKSQISKWAKQSEKMPHFQVTGIILPRVINKDFLTWLNEHTVYNTL